MIVVVFVAVEFVALTPCSPVWDNILIRSNGLVAVFFVFFWKKKKGGKISWMPKMPAVLVCEQS